MNLFKKKVAFIQDYHDVKTSEIYPTKQYVLDWLKQPKVFNKYAKIADAIWSYAELGMQEFNSSKLLADNLEAAGFKVERGLAGMPTCFVASYGLGKPIIGILAEYDALPALSQEGGNPNKAPLVEGAPGHGCGHQTICSAASAAAESIKNAMDKFGIKGTIKVFGSPAEEELVGKPFMVNAGLFEGIDAVIDSHPGLFESTDEEGTGLSTGYYKGSGNALFSTEFSFTGVTAHSGRAWDGKSALCAVEIMDVATNFLQKYLIYSSRINYVITSGGDVPGLIPDKASVWYSIRNSDTLVEQDYAKVVNCAKAAALATGTELSIRVLSAIHQNYTSKSMAKVIQSNIQLVGMPTWTAEEDAFAKTLQKNLGKEETGMATSVGKLKIYKPSATFVGGGSSDVSEVSLVAPVAGVRFPANVTGDFAHHWSRTASGTTTISHKGANYATQTMAAVALDLFTKPDMLKEIRAEFEEQAKMYPFKSRIPDGTTPPNNLNATLMDKYRPLMEPYYLIADTTPIGPEISN